MNILVVSPHFDDAPLSLGQSLVDGELSRHRVEVGVVFSRTNWVRWFHPTPARARLVGAIRRSEEALASALFGYKVRVGGLEEAILRTGDLDADSFLDPTFDPGSSPLLGTVVGVVDAWAARADVVLVPLGAGDHVDHRLVARAGTVLAGAGRQVAFYEDRPYASALDDGQIAALAHGLDPALECRDVSGPVGRAKHRRLFYPSQIDGFFRDAIDADVAGRRHERVWVSPTSPWPPRNP